MALPLCGSCPGPAACRCCSSYCWRCEGRRWRRCSCVLWEQQLYGVPECHIDLGLPGCGNATSTCEQAEGQGHQLGEKRVLTPGPATVCSTRRAKSHCCIWPTGFTHHCQHSAHARQLEEQAATRLSQLRVHQAGSWMCPQQAAALRSASSCMCWLAQQPLTRWHSLPALGALPLVLQCQANADPAESVACNRAAEQQQQRQWLVCRPLCIVGTSRRCVYMISCCCCT
jgi:hypothetical protein